MRRQIDELYKRKRVVENQIERLRKNCKHAEYYCAMYSWRVGCYDLERLCKDCDALIGGDVTPGERKIFYKEHPEWNAGRVGPSSVTYEDTP